MSTLEVGERAARLLEALAAWEQATEERIVEEALAVYLQVRRIEEGETK